MRKLVDFLRLLGFEKVEPGLIEYFMECWLEDVQPENLQEQEWRILKRLFDHSGMDR